ncbi:hypothetical protein LIER_04551 [Lithospermum erythrorhizon]|uniref:Uncharacterized protein n=1 Tax=Lithospermum erythrorhizon TaxID=34254 RepID=A0AAV3NZV2_LITER
MDGEVIVVEWTSMSAIAKQNARGRSTITRESRFEVGESSRVRNLRNWNNNDFRGNIVSMYLHQTIPMPLAMMPFGSHEVIPLTSKLSKQLEATREESLNDNHLGAVIPIPPTDDTKLIRFFEDWSDFKIESIINWPCSRFEWSNENEATLNSSGFLDGFVSVNGLDLDHTDKDSGKSFTASSSSEKERRIGGFVICKSMSLIIISGIIFIRRIEWFKAKALKEREFKEIMIWANQTLEMSSVEVRPWNKVEKMDDKIRDTIQNLYRE